MGYSIDLFINQDQIDEEFICSICQEVMKDPPMSEICEHIFCKSCLQEWNKSSRTCPADRERIGGLRAPIRAFMNMYNRFKIHCDLPGCEQVINLGQITDHIKNCKYNIIPCIHDCGASLQVSKVQDHDCIKYLKQLMAEEKLQVVQLKLFMVEIEEKVAKCQEEHDQEMSLRFAEIEALTNKIENSDEVIRELREETEHILEENAESLSVGNNQMEQLKAEIYDLKREIETRKVEHAQELRSKANVGELQKQIENLKGEIEKCKPGRFEELRGKNAEIDELRRIIQMLNDEIEKMALEHAAALRGKDREIGEIGLGHVEALRVKDKEINELKKEVLNGIVNVDTEIFPRVVNNNERRELTLNGVKQFYIHTKERKNKFVALKKLCNNLSNTKAIIICNTGIRVYLLEGEVVGKTCTTIEALHSGHPEQQRDEIIRKFQAGYIHVLMTPELLGDVLPDASLVINYDLPINPKDYIHRIIPAETAEPFGIPKVTVINFISKED